MDLGSLPHELSPFDQKLTEKPWFHGETCQKNLSSFELQGGYPWKQHEKKNDTKYASNGGRIDEIWHYEGSDAWAISPATRNALDKGKLSVEVQRHGEAVGGEHVAGGGGGAMNRS